MGCGSPSRKWTTLLMLMMMTGRVYIRQSEQVKQPVWYRRPIAWHASLRLTRSTPQASQRPASNDNQHVKRRRLNERTAYLMNLSQSYGASAVIRDHTVLYAIWHRWTLPALALAIQASTWFTYPRRMEGWVALGGWLHRDGLTVHKQSPI